MKCYIATYYKYNNYGTRLQNFALCQTISKLGAEPVTIYIKSKKEFFKNIIKNLGAHLPSVTKKQKLWVNDYKKEQAFKKFNDKLNLKKINYSDLCKIDFSDSIAIAGSDQIWSPTHLVKNAKDINLYFLKFAPQAVRYAYAPSFGVDKIPENLKEMYIANLENFNKITIRENAGEQIITDLISKKVAIMPDPVFLLSKVEWQNEIKDLSLKECSEDYIFTYFLGNRDDDLWKKIEKYARKNNYKIISIAGNDYNKNNIIPSPDEFVYLIDNAKAVFTDSFHASAFSIIMETPFLVFKRNDVKQFSRIETLLNKYACEKSMINDINKLNDNDFIPYVNLKIKNILESERKKGLKFLEEIIKKGSE